MQPFTNIRVIDLTHVIAGPFCTYQLAVLGADVIKIEPPDQPDMVRAKSKLFPLGEDGLSPTYNAQNGNKRAVSIDLKSEQGRVLLKQLIATADVFVENYRSGAMAKLGLGYDDLRKIQPNIIYCSLTGFGQDGPKGSRTAYDNIIQAYSGLMSATGNEETAPTKVGPPVLDYGTGIQAAFAISAALFQRTRTGNGQFIDIAMLDSAIMLMSSDATYQDQTKKPVPLTGNMSKSNAGYGCYQTKRGLLMLGAYTGQQARNLWIVLGDSEYGEELSVLQPPEMSERKEKDTIRISEILLGKSAEKWEQELNAQKVPAARVRTLEETLDDDQLKTRTVIQSLDHDVSHARIPVAAFKFAENGPALTSLPPVFGQHTNQVLKELGYNDGEIDNLESQGVVARARPLPD